MTETVDIRIALLVGSNGKAAVAIDDANTDWGLLADCIADYPDDRSPPRDPDQSVRHIVKVTVPLPRVADLKAVLASREAEALERAAQVAERAALMSYAPYQHPENIATAIRALIPAPLAGKQEGRS